MGIAGLNLISNLFKAHERQAADRSRLVLAGLNQTVFLKQWGEPETQIGLNRLGRLNNLGSMFVITDPTEAPYSVWIYKKRDRILLFTKKKLVSHFRWKEFRQESDYQPPQAISKKHGIPSIMSTAISLV
jgi:hypothetical protein